MVEQSEMEMVHELRVLLQSNYFLINVILKDGDIYLLLIFNKILNGIAAWKMNSYFVSSEAENTIWVERLKR